MVSSAAPLPPSKVRTNIRGFIGHFLLPCRPPSLPHPFLSSPFLLHPRASQLEHGERTAAAAAAPIPAEGRRRQSDLEKAKRERLEKVCSSPMGGHQFCGLPCERGRGLGRRWRHGHSLRTRHLNALEIWCEATVSTSKPHFAQFRSLNDTIHPISSIYCSRQGEKKDGRHYREHRA